MAKILGQDRLAKKLRQLPLIAKEEIRKALGQSADEIVALARSLAPKDSGELARSIDWTWGEAPKGAMVLARGKVGDLTLTIFAGNDEAYYARWVEFGTQKMQAQPFFFVSYRALRKRTKSRITRATTKAAKKVATSS